MKFHDPIICETRSLMQVVDILRDDPAMPAGFEPFLNGLVPCIGFRACHHITIEFSPPRLSSSFFRTHEILELDGLNFVPQASAGAAKVGNSRLGTDTCSGEKNGVLALAKQGSQLRHR
jgi:hypothetical protein